MIYEEKRFMAISEIEKECCTGCCFMTMEIAS